MVTVKLFAAAADAVGRRTLEGDWAGRTTAQLLEILTQQYPNLARLAPVLSVAVNREYAPADRVLADGDEVALIPPVSGGADDPEPPLFAITTEPLSADEIAARVTNPHSGATLVFVGTVREWTRGRRTVYLEYEAYPEMAVAQMEQIGREIAERWPGARTAIVHRVGRLEIGEASVVIAVATPHRADAFEACRHAIERLKQIVPIWKKEVWEDGEAWVGSQIGPDWMHQPLKE
ncbi:MAG: molybdopterin converting factor [Symbiobacterium thermophilum]|uniref:Molybdopterin synthase catalytic subunit n=1 Tax=Symbiobacterium thermophilum TaxID=2734 RepID=A0A953I3Z4_SYMTR|nr:molybdopterin converting factor [Symbiobacterium thermophilum]